MLKRAISRRMMAVSGLAFGLFVLVATTDNLAAAGGNSKQAGSSKANIASGAKPGKGKWTRVDKRLICKSGLEIKKKFPAQRYPYAVAPNKCDYIRDRLKRLSSGSGRNLGYLEFADECNAHDRCYFTLGSNPDQCNRKFHGDLLSACQKNYCKGGKCTPAINLCRSIANRIASAVYAMAPRAFRGAQAKQAEYLNYVKRNCRVVK